MKGDFSKDTFNAKKHFRDVLMQQGRVLLGSDWNEQAEITAHRIETTTEDIIGESGAPMHDAGFQILPAAAPTNITISAGRFYVDGILCENETDLLLFTDQPDFDATALPTSPAGNYIFYLDVWLRHITALEDGDIREVALGGPDTTTRSKTTWQVKCIADNAANCDSALPASISDPSTGTLIARAEVPTGSDNPCGLVTSGGYRRLENQLYRVEIHKAGINRATSTFKWSRDNGSVLVKWKSIDSSDPTKLVVSSTGRDELLGFKTGDWIELIDDRTDLLGLPGVLVQLKKVEDNALFIDTTTVIPLGNPITLSTKNPRIRRWDSVGGEVRLNTNNSTWVPLEDGIEVNFKEGTFKTGDYWLIPARTATADIEWPFTTPQLPLGIKHHFAKLGILSLATPAGAAPSWALFSDCRPVFPPITELTSLYYVGGDGQEAMPNSPLPTSLKVGVANGKWPVAGAKVKFEFVIPGAGTLAPVSGGITNSNGIAECLLTLGAIPPNINFSLQVRASLLGPDGITPLPNQLPVIFNASFNVADNVAYTGGDCTNWPNSRPTNVAEALTALCKRENSSKKSCTVSVGEGAQFGTLKEAFDNLAHERDICICLLPGQEHKVEDITVTEKTTIKISGCGAVIIMVGKVFDLNASKLIFQGFSLLALDANAQIILLGNRVNVDHCIFRRKEDDKTTPFIVLKNYVSDAEKLATVNWNATQINASVALAIGRGFGGWIENNILEGDLLLQYTEDFKQFGWESITPDIRNIVQQKLSSTLSINDNGEAMHIRGNTMTRAITNIFTPLKIPSVFAQGNQVTIKAYKSLFVSENIFNGIRTENVLPGNFSTFIADMTNLSNNEFLNGKRNTVIAYCLGQKAIITGNIDPLFNGDNGAFIDDLFNMKIIAPNLIKVLQ